MIKFSKFNFLSAIKRKRGKKPSILILGASGGVGQAVLGMLSDYRDRFSKVILLDRHNKVLHARYIDHKKLDYEFLRVDFGRHTIKDVLEKAKRDYGISIVLDLTDYETLPILSAADQLGLSYMNCSLNSEDDSMSHFVDDMITFSARFTNKSHVLSMGMNPGIANHLIIKGVLEHGAPKEFIEIEYDSGMPRVDTGKPFITWSKKQFLNEAVWSKSGYCEPGGIYKELDKTAIETLLDTKEFIQPVKKLDSYPLGMVVSHDEVIAMARILEIPGKFIYAIHPLSLARLIKFSELKKRVGESDIVFEDNTVVPLDGSDFVGVWLRYPLKDVCYYIDVPHTDIRGTNATLYMVAVGVIAGLIEFIENPLAESGVYSVLDLNNENFLKIVSRYLKIRKFEKMNIAHSAMSLEKGVKTA